MRAKIVIIGIPAYKGQLSADTLAGLADVGAASNRFNADPVFIPRVIPNKYCNCSARNKSIYNGNFKKSWIPDFDYFFSTDSDMEFSAVLIRRLIQIAEENKNKCIVSAAYVNRHIDTDIVAGTWAKNGRALGQISRQQYFEMFEDGNDVARVGWVGLGACLIPAGIIKAAEDPFFKHHYFENPETGETEEFEDDLSLCKKLFENEIPVLLSKYRVKHDGKAV